MHRPTACTSWSLCCSGQLPGWECQPGGGGCLEAQSKAVCVATPATLEPGTDSNTKVRPSVTRHRGDDMCFQTFRGRIKLSPSRYGENRSIAALLSFPQGWHSEARHSSSFLLVLPLRLLLLPSELLPAPHYLTHGM